MFKYKKQIYYINLALGLTLSAHFSFSQINNKIWNYINTYRDIAISEMERTGIPASITLAQGLLESGIGESRLATEANNHFGIKCHDWTGPSVRHTDDAPNECFRKYNSAYESYLDHSDFLTGRKRYQILFTYPKDDYVKWAKGLKQCGYATNPKYAELLIQKIELYYLHIFDKPDWQELWAIVETNRALSLGERDVQTTYTTVTSSTKSKSNSKTGDHTVTAIIEASKVAEERQVESSDTAEKENTKSESTASVTNEKKSIATSQPNSIKTDSKKAYEFLRINGCDAVVYNYPITVADIAARHQVKMKQLYCYNEIEKFVTFPANEPVYLKKKKRKYKGNKAVHQVEIDETIATISLKYGVQQQTLRKLNLLYPTQEPKMGELVYLKKRRKVPPKIDG